MRLALLTLLFPVASLAAQDTLVVDFKGVTCTAEQRAAGAFPSPDWPDSATLARVDPPRINAPLPENTFRPLASHSPPYWAHLTFVVDSTGRPDLCTVRVVRANEPRWTTHVLEHLTDLRYRPAFWDGRPRRLYVEQRFLFRGDTRRRDDT